MQIYDPIRQKHVKATKEECVRQALLVDLLKKGYPSGLISVERKLKDLVEIQEQKVPMRRIDVVCFAEKTLRPLLIIECKAVSFTLSTVYQVMGYNQFLRAPFVAVVNQHKVIVGWYHKEKKSYLFMEQIPSYQELLGMSV